MNEQKRSPRIGAFTPPPGGQICIGDKEIITPDFCTLSRYREYARCGFEEILFSGEDKYCGEPFAKSRLKKMLDLAARAGLCAIVYDERLLRLTRQPKEKLVGELFDSQEELNAYVAECLRTYADHPAFYGVSAADEPLAERAVIFSEFCAAVHAFRGDIYVHTCYLPMASEIPTQLAVGTGGDIEKSYADYVDAMCAAGPGYFCYDAYPFGMWEGKNDMRQGYIRNMQIASLRSAANGVPFFMTIQSFSSGAKDELRRVDEGDLNWQANIALGFGCKKIYYFTYWRFTTRVSADYFTSAIIDEDGTRLLYDQAKRNNALIVRILDRLEGYVYTRSQYCGEGPVYKAAAWLHSEPVGLFSSVKSSAALLINELKREAGRAYMVLNLRDPYEKYRNVCRLKFAEPITQVMMMRRGKMQKIAVSDGELRMALQPGEAVWLFFD